MFVTFVVTAAQSHDFSESFPGFEVVNVPSDGQCAFSAISHQLIARNLVNCEKSAKSGSIVRREVVDFLATDEELKTRISNRLVEDQTIDKYISDMRLPETWADEDILYVASICYDVQITVRRSESDADHIGSSLTDRSIDLGYVCSDGSSPSPNHYVSLLPKANAGMILLLCSQFVGFSCKSFHLSVVYLIVV